MATPQPEQFTKYWTAILMTALLENCDCKVCKMIRKMAQEMNKQVVREILGE